MHLLTLEPWMLALLMLPALLNLFCIWHAVHSTFPGGNERIWWILAGVFLPVIGGVLYILFGLRRSRKPEVKKNI